MDSNGITYQIRGAAFRVHATLGPGLLESVYEAALKYELEKVGLKVQHQVGIPMIYEEIKLDLVFRLDLLETWAMMQFYLSANVMIRNAVIVPVRIF